MQRVYYRDILWSRLELKALFRLKNTRSWLMKHGKTLKIFVMGDSPSCLKQVEIVNWTGLAFIGGREHIQQARSRKELATPGIYFLLSDSSEDGGLIDFYVGETDDFSIRVIDHLTKKDWWTRFVVFTSKDHNLTKAHVKFLEQEIDALAKESLSILRRRNTQDPGGSILPESDVASMNEFLTNMLFVLETLGLSYFASERGVAPGVPIQEGMKSSNVDVSSLGDFRMTLTKETSGGSRQYSTLYFKNGMYILKAGSFITKIARDSFQEHGTTYYPIWKQIVESDAVEVCEFDGLLRTKRELEFRSPSAAGSVVKGRNTNGKTDWKRVSDGKSIAECLLQMGE